MQIGQYLDIEKSGELKRNGQTDIFFIAVLESWEAKIDVKKFLAQSEKKTDRTHYGIDMGSCANPCFISFQNITVYYL